MTKFIDSNQYLNLMINDEKKHIRILALFAKLKSYHFENYEQVNRFIKRYTKAAKELDCYDLQRVKKTLEYLLKTVNYKVTLETVIKFIDEDIQGLEEDPIIILSNGEKVYDTGRLKQLETEGRIRYKGGKWVEV